MGVGRSLLKLTIGGGCVLGSLAFPPLLAGENIAWVTVLATALSSVAAGNTANALDALTAGQDPDRVSLENQDLTKAVGKAIAAVITLAAKKHSGETRQYLEKIAAQAKDNWVKIAQQELTQERYPALREAKLDQFLTPEEYQLTQQGNLTDTEWKDIFIRLNMAACQGGGYSIPSNVYQQVAELLCTTFPNALRETLKEDFAKDGKAFAGLTLQLLTGMQAQLRQLQASPEAVNIKELEQIRQKFQELETQLRGDVTQQQEFFSQISKNINSGFAQVCQNLAGMETTISGLLQTLEKLRQEMTEFRQEVRQGFLDPLNTSYINFCVYDQEWVGRESILDELSCKINNSCRVLLLVGLTGIGKTALAEKLVEKLRGVWAEDRENFENSEKSSDFVSIAVQWLQRWGEFVAPEQRQSQQLRRRLIKRLCNNKHLILMDSLEYLLTGNVDEGWGGFTDPDWATFFIELLAEPNCSSRFILTSQDLPTQFETADFDRYKNYWFCQLLKGLDCQEQIELFKKVKLDYQLEVADSPLRLIGQVYDGHPLALRVIAGEIKQKYNSKVEAYWKDNGLYIQNVKRDLDLAHRQLDAATGVDDRWKLDSYTRALRKLVRERVQKTLKRLSDDVPDAYLLLCAASIYRCEVPEDWWLTHLECRGYDRDRQINAMQALRDRYLVEDGGINEENERLVGQHNLIRSVAISHRLEL